MAIENREAFLNRIAGKLGRKPRTTGVSRPTWKHQPQWNVYQNYSLDQLVEVFKKQCQAIHTRYEQTDLAGLPDVLSRVISQYEAKSIITTGDPRFRQFGVDRFLDEGRSKNDWQIHVWDTETNQAERHIELAEKADIGITFSDMTLAESATVVLYSEGEKGRSVSLLPLSYLAIIPKSTLVPRFTQAAREIHQRIERGEAIASCINFISGPSNSADIEMNLVVGVHGPIQATYVMVEDI